MTSAQEKNSLHLHGQQGVTEKIKKAMYNAAKEFVYIGFLLWEVQEYNYFYEGGYINVYEYAEKELGFKRSSTKNFIAVARTFGNKYYEKCKNSTTQIYLPTMTLQPKYEEFNYSQLTEMLSMSAPQRDKVTPDMTIKEIRKIKKEPEFTLEPNAETIKLPLPDDDQAKAKKSGQTSGQPETQAVTVNNIWKDLPPEIIKAIVKAGGLKYNPRSSYTITIELKKG